MLFVLICSMILYERCFLPVYSWTSNDLIIEDSSINSTHNFTADSCTSNDLMINDPSINSTHNFTADSCTSNDLMINDPSINSTHNFTATEEILSIVDFIREKKKFVKFSIVIHQSGMYLEHQNSAVELWHQLWKLGVSALVSIVENPVVERENNEELLIFYSTENLAVQNEPCTSCKANNQTITMMSRVRPLYIISGDMECKNGLTGIASLIPADIEVYVVSLCDGTIYEAYHFDPDNPVVRAIGERNEEIGFWFLRTEQSMWMRRKKMDGLKICGKGFRPLIFDRNDPLYDSMMVNDRYAVEVWSDLTQFLNFTLLIVEGNIVNKTQNSTQWDGMIGLLGDQGIDVSTTLVTITEKVAEGYAMKATVFTASFRLIFHNPLNHKHMLMPNLLNPFNRKLWLALACMLFLLLPFVLVVLLWKETEFSNAALLPLRCITAQGLGISPERTSARVGCLVTLFFCYIMVTFYESLLITFLTSSQSYQPFTTLEEFYARGYGFDLIYHQDMSWAFLDQKTTSEDSDPISKLRRGIPPPKRNRVLPLSSRVEAGKRLCKYPQNTTIFDVPFRQGPLIKCPYFTTKHKYLLMHFGIGARHNLSAYPFIARMIRSMDEHGIIDRIKQSFRLTQYKSIFKSFSFHELGAVFFIYYLAILFSVIILLLEVLWFHGQKMYKAKFPLKNKTTRRRYHNKRIKDLQNVLELQKKFSKS